MACHVQSSPLDFQPSHQGIDDIFSRLPAIAPQHSNRRSWVYRIPYVVEPRMDDFWIHPRSLTVKAPEKMVVFWRLSSGFHYLGFTHFFRGFQLSNFRWIFIASKPQFNESPGIQPTKVTADLLISASSKWRYFYFPAFPKVDDDEERSPKPLRI